MHRLIRWSAVVGAATFVIGFAHASSPVGVVRALATISQVGTDIDGEAANDQSGYSVAMSSDGTRIVVGAPYNDDNGSDAGQVRVYTLTGGSWTQTGSDINGKATNDYFGFSVAISSDGTSIAVSAPANDDNGSDAGQVRVYTLTGGTWTQTGSDINGEAAGDQWGNSVAMSSDGASIAIGAPFNDGNGSNSGHVRVYTLTGGTWTQTGSDIDGEAVRDYSGGSVDMSSDGTTVAIGATNNDGNGSNSGHVRVYTLTGGAWTLTGSDIDGEVMGDQSGYSVALSSDGSRIAIGATFNENNGSGSGHVRVFALSSGTWTQTGSDINGEAANDYSGYSVAMSSDGATVVVGAKGNDGNGSDTGHVRIFTLTGGSWIQSGSDIDGEATGDQSGFSVAVSSDGTSIAVGAIYNDGGGSNAGHVRVFDVAITSPTTTTTTTTTSTSTTAVPFTTAAPTTTVATTTTTAPTRAISLPATGPQTSQLFVLAMALASCGALVMLARRRITPYSPTCPSTASRRRSA